VKVKDLIQKLQELSTRYETAKTRLEGVDRREADLQQRIRAQEEGRRAAEARVQTQTERVRQLETALTAAQVDLEAADDREAALKKKLRLLEKHKAGLQDKCIELEKTRKALAERLGEGGAPPSK